MAISLEEKIDEAKSILTVYLETHKLRKTPERYVILEEIYQRDDHFDAEALYLHMKQQNYGVSRATVYNTLDLLVNSELVIKHQFGKNQTQYERAFGYKQHDHLICIKCKNVEEFSDPKVQQIEDNIGKTLKFKIKHRSLMLYGICESCSKEENN